MHIKTVATLPHAHRPAMGLSHHDMLMARFRGLGYTYGGDVTDTTTTVTTDPGRVNVDTLTDPFATGTTTGTPLATTPTGFGPSGLFTADQMNQLEAGSLPSGLTTAELAALAPYYGTVGIIPSSPTSASLASSGFTAAQATAILSAAGQAAINAYKATSSPGVIPGTNLVYNPATGQVMNAAGAAVSGGTPAGATIGQTSSLSMGTILLLLGFAALVLIEER